MYVFTYTPKYLLTGRLKVTYGFYCDGYGSILKINSFEIGASSMKDTKFPPLLNHLNIRRKAHIKYVMDKLQVFLVDSWTTVGSFAKQ